MNEVKEFIQGIIDAISAGDSRQLREAAGWYESNTQRLEELLTKIDSRGKKIGIYSGMFDPFHEGHRSVLNQACVIFDEVHVIIGPNPSKTPLFTLEERKEQLTNCIPFSNVKIGVLEEKNIIEYAKKLTVDHDVTIIRGIRSEKDFHYENTILNCMREKAYGTNITFTYFISEDWLKELSSSKIKDWCRQGRWECVNYFVPNLIGKALFHKFWDGIEQCGELTELVKERDRVMSIFYGPENSIFETTTAGFGPVGGFDFDWCDCFQLREKPQYPVDDGQSLQQIADGGPDRWTIGYQPTEEMDRVQEYFKRAEKAGLIQLPKEVCVSQVYEMLDACNFDPIMSLTFYLMEIPVDKVRPTGTRYQPQTTSVGPIIVDKNFADPEKDDYFNQHFSKLGPALIIEGKHRWLDAVERGQETIWAWVGEEIVDHFK